MARVAREVAGIIGALAFAVCLTPRCARAQNSPGESLSLVSAVDRALNANPTIAAARLTRAVNLAGLAVASERPNPEVSVEIEKETPKQSVGIGVPIELGGKRTRRLAVSEATIRSGDAELAATIAQVRNDVRRAYYDVQVADARSAVLRELRDISQRVVDTAQARFNAGDAARLEVVQAGLGLAAAENEAAAADSATRAARIRLNALLGQSLDVTQSLSTPLDPGTPIASASALDVARTASSELTLLDRQIDEQRAKLALAQAMRTPDIVPTATLTHDAEPEFTYGWRAGLGVTLPLFSTHKAGVQVEQATLERLLGQRQAALQRITGEVSAAVAAAEAQRQTYVRYRDVILPQAQQVEQLAQDSYQLGQTGLPALLQALQASRDLRLRSLDALAQLQTALADLERAIGAPLP